MNKLNEKLTISENKSLIDECKELINEAAWRVFNAKETTDFEKVLIESRQTVYSEYIRYLNLYYLKTPKFTDCTLKNKDDRINVYKVIFILISDSDKKIITDTLKSFNPCRSNSNGYFGYLFSAINTQFKKIKKQEEFADKHMGMTGVFADKKRDVKTLKKIIKLIYENTSDGKLKNESVKKLSKDYGVSESKIIEIYNASNNAYVMSFYHESNESEEEVDMTAKTVYTRYFETRDPLDGDFPFTELVDLMNDLYINHFTNNCRKFYPPFLSNLIIEVFAEDIGKALKCTSKQVLNNYIEDLDIPAIKHQYADGSCYCIIAVVFDWVLENKKFLLQKHIAEYFNVGKSHVSKTIDQVQDMLKRRLNEYR